MTTLQQLTNDIASSADMIAMHEGRGSSKEYLYILKQKISEIEKIVISSE